MYQQFLNTFSSIFLIFVLFKLDSKKQIDSNKKEQKEHKVENKKTIPPQNNENSQYKELFQKYDIKKCGIRWKPLTMKCALPTCHTISERTMYVARLGDLTRPRFILLCENHRDVTEPGIYGYLSQRLGDIYSLRKSAIEVCDSDSDVGKHDDGLCENISQKRILDESPREVSSNNKKLKIDPKQTLDNEEIEVEKVKEKSVNKKTTQIDNTKALKSDSPIPNKKRAVENLEVTKTLEPEPTLKTGRATRASGIKPADIPLDYITALEKRTIKHPLPDTVNSDELNKSKEPEISNKKSDWRTIFKPKSKNKSRRRGKKPKGKPNSDSTESSPSTLSANEREDGETSESQHSTEYTEKNYKENNSVVEKTASNIISLDSDDETNSSKSNDDNPIIGNCCIPGCTTGEIERGETYFVAKIGEDPNIEYVLLCNQHRDCLDNVQNLEQVGSDTQFSALKTAEGPYILEEGELPSDAMIKISTNKLQQKNSRIPHNVLDSPVKDSVSTPIQVVRPTIQREEEEINAGGHRLVSRTCVQMTGKSGAPEKFILEDWSDGTIIYTPAPPDLPMGDCSKKRLDFYKQKQILTKEFEEAKQRQRFNTIPSPRLNTIRPAVPSSSRQPIKLNPPPSQNTIQLNTSHILSSSHIKPAGYKTNDPKLTGDAGKSELVYIGGKPFLLTSVEEKRTNTAITPPKLPKLPTINNVIQKSYQQYRSIKTTQQSRPTP